MSDKELNITTEEEVKEILNKALDKYDADMIDFNNNGSVELWEVEYAEHLESKGRGLS